MHLALESLDMLEIKGVKITEDEATGLLLAILMHDIGHGRFQSCTGTHVDRTAP
jgi:HD superfamily phosphohydrolase